MKAASEGAGGRAEYCRSNLEKRSLCQAMGGLRKLMRATRDDSG